MKEPICIDNLKAGTDEFEAIAFNLFFPLNIAQ
jgi:hypothetical protein